MAKRTFIFTEEQAKHIFGEDFVAYLDKSDQGCNYPSQSNTANGCEVAAKEPEAETNPTLDKISARRSKSYPFYVHRVSGLSERNHGLDGKEFSLGKNTNQEIQNTAGKLGTDKMLNNMANNKNATANCLYVRKNRLNKMKKEDPLRYQKINGKGLEKSIKSTLNRATSATKVNNTNINTNNIVNGNVMNKQGRTKNNQTIYYEQD